MLNILVSVVLAAGPIVNRAAYTIDGPSPKITHNNVKLLPDSSVIINDTMGLPPGDGWRVMAPQYQRNLLFIDDTTLAIIWAPYSGDTSGEFFLGAKVSYSTDGGATWTSYDLDATNMHHRLYPSAYFDKTTNTPWFAWMENSSANGIHIYVAYDQAFPYGVFTKSELTYNTDSVTAPYLPNIVAHGDTVSVIAIDLGNGHLEWWKSTDHGNTWTEDFTTLTNLFGGDYDTPFQLYKDGRLFVVTASANDDVMRFAYSDDFGTTWQGPFDLSLPVDSAYANASWWDNYDAIVDNAGNLHVFAGINFATIWHAKYDFVQNAWTTPYLIDGDTLANVDTMNFHNAAYIPSASIDQNGNIYVTYTYFDSMTVNDTLHGGEEAKVAKLNEDGTFTVLGYLDGDFTQEDLNYSVWGEASYNVMVDANGMLVIPFVWVDGANNYTNFYYYRKGVSGVKERRNAFTPFIMNSSIISSNGEIKFAVPTKQSVNIGLYTVDGRRVKTLYNGIASQGEHSINFSAGNLPRGIYIVNYQDTRGTFSHKILVK